MYGGWICGAPLSGYVALLDNYDAWKGIDVFDMHYMPVGAMDTLYQPAKKRRVANPAVWQMELGFTTQDKFLADVYPRVSTGRSARDQQGKRLGGRRVQVPIIDADPAVHTLNQKENEDIFYLALQQG